MVVFDIAASFSFVFAVLGCFRSFPFLLVAERELEACDDDITRAQLIKEAAHAALLLRRTSTSLFAAIDGPKLLVVCKEAYLGTFAAFAAVLSSTAAKVGIGLDLGTKVANAVNAVVAPVVAKMLRTLRDCRVEINQCFVASMA